MKYHQAILFLAVSVGIGPILGFPFVWIMRVELAAAALLVIISVLMYQDSLRTRRREHARKSQLVVDGDSLVGKKNEGRDSGVYDSGASVRSFTGRISSHV